MKESRYVSLELEGHCNIYRSGIYEEIQLSRKIRTDLVFPQKGIDENTGVLMLITGYGATIDSHVFEKMREKFSNLYNMVVTQCDYYGSKYMGKEMLEDAYDKLQKMKNFWGGGGSRD